MGIVFMNRFLNGILLAILCISLLIVIIRPQNAKSSPDVGASWLTGWTYRKSHTIDSAAGAGVNYTLQIIVVNATGVDSGDTVYVYNKTKSDFSDVRFTASDGITQLYYWNEAVNIGVSATFWVKDTDNLTAASSAIYVYYGNSAASWDSTYCNIHDTFVFADDFESGSLSTYWTSVGSAWTDQSTIKYAGNYAAEGMPNGVGVPQILDKSGLPSFAGARWMAEIQRDSTIGIVYFFDSRLGPSDQYLLCSYYGNFEYYDGDWHELPVPTSMIDGTWYSVQLLLNYTTETYEVWINGAYKGTIAGVLGGSGLTDIRHNVGPTADYGIGYVDNSIVARYVDPEPEQGAWGTEESASVTVYGYTDKPFYEPGDTGTIQFWVYNSGTEDLVLKNITIYYPWYNPEAFWDGNTTIVPSAATIISAGGNWTGTSSFTVPNDGRISSASNSITINVATDKTTQSSSISMSLASGPYYSFLQDMDQLQTLLVILVAAIVICTLIIAAALFFSGHRLQKVPKPQ
jgi:hypothetical protein